MNETIPPEELEPILKRLAVAGFRVTRPLELRPWYSDATAPGRLMKAVVLDTETTGTVPGSDRIIELGLVVFEYCPETGQAYKVLEVFDQLEDPRMPIPVESTKVHGITDEMVKGKRIDDAKVASIVSDVSLVIAHNARFDRAFVESRFPVFEKKAWACSFAQVPWDEEGISSAKLEFLAYRFGFHFGGHRASNDCLALLEILQQTLPESGERVMRRLLARARIKDLVVGALGAPFESKDALKARGYRWNAERKLWSCNVAETGLEQEAAWLKSTVHGGRAFRIEIEKLDAFNRFSVRRGATETRNIS